jgi:hypothetical protein
MDSNPRYPFEYNAFSSISLAHLTSQVRVAKRRFIFGFSKAQLLPRFRCAVDHQ